MNAIENIKKANAEYLDLYGDIFSEIIELREMPTFQTILSYFKETDTMLREFSYKGKQVIAKRKFTYKGFGAIKTNYLHILIERKKRDLKHGSFVIVFDHYRQTSNNEFKFLGYNEKYCEIN